MLENGANWIYEKRISNFDRFTNESTGLQKNPIIRNWKNEMLENGANWIYENRISNFDGFTNESTRLRKKTIIRN